MTVNEKEILIADKFYDDLLGIEEYISDYSSSKAKKLTKRIFDFIIDTISVFPQAFPIFEYYFDELYEYRRAVFQKNYVIVYRINLSKVEFLRIYHASRNPDNVTL